MNAASPSPTEREFDHPLRALPWVRHLPDTLWVSIILTAVLAVVGALALTIADPFSFTSRSFGARLFVNLVYGLAIGYSIHLLSHLHQHRLRNWLARRPFALRLLFDALVWVVGVLTGSAIAALLLGHQIWMTESLYFIIGAALLISFFAGIAQRGHALRDLRAEREKNERLEAQRALAATRLRLLQAQIEPHFLFNTLANVSSLIEANPKQARTMLDQFTLLLRALLDQTRQSVTTVRKELQVAEAYLSVLKIRMGDRLSFRVDAPTELMDTEVPGMLLQPIVENAVKHGIEPRIDGGVVRIVVRREDNQLLLAVFDNGVGFVNNPTESIGLGAIRERLAVQFGQSAQLQVERTPDQWTQVAIRIPMPVSTPAVSTPD